MTKEYISVVIDLLGIVTLISSDTLGTNPTPATMTTMTNPIEATIITAHPMDYHVPHTGSRTMMGMTPHADHLMDQVATEGEATVEEEGDHQVGEEVEHHRMLTADGTVVSQCPRLQPPEMAHQGCTKQQSTIGD